MKFGWPNNITTYCRHVHSLSGHVRPAMSLIWAPDCLWCVFVFLVVSCSSQQEYLAQVLSWLLSLPTLTALSDVKQSLSLPHTINVKAGLWLVYIGQNFHGQPIESLVCRSQHHDKMSNSVQNKWLPPQISHSHPSPLSIPWIIITMGQGSVVVNPRNHKDIYQYLSLLILLE